MEITLTKMKKYKPFCITARHRNIKTIIIYMIIGKLLKFAPFGLEVGQNRAVKMDHKNQR